MATNTAASFTNHTGNGTAGPFSISFSYLSEAEVDVTVGGVLKTITTHYTFTSATQITFTSGNEPGNGVAIKFQRDTDISAKKVDFQDGSVLTETDLDNNADQVLFAQQEIIDKLGGIEENATADQTNAEIKTAYEANSDTNAFSDAEKTKLQNLDLSKLQGIETGATADQSNAEIKTAYEANSDTNAFTDAEKTKLAGISASAGATTFVGLGDTPANFTGAGGKTVKVNSSANALEFVDSVDLTALSASNLTSGTIPDARFPATLPAASAANLTNIPAANITGTLPAISGANLTAVDAATVDGIDSASFLRSDAADSASGLLSLNGGITLTGGAAANVTALSDGATITIDMATACHHSVTLGGNRTFAAPSNQVVGQAGSIFITQDGTGSRTASFNSAFKFVGGTAPTLTTTAAAVDRIDYIILSSNVIHCAVSLDVK